jgi:hypothetical protein
MLRCTARFAVFAFLFTVSPSALAEPIVIAASGSRDDVQAAVDALGGPGVVLVRPGEWVLGGTVTIAADDVVVLGSGAANTRLYRTTEDATAFFSADGVARFRFAGFHVQGNAARSSAALEVGVRVNGVEDFRVDHCFLQHLGNSGVHARASRGVVDHTTIRDGYKPEIGNFGYGVAVYGDDTYSGLPYGTPEAVFIEDNAIDGARHASASNRGARYVFRYNHVTGTEVAHAVDSHGDEYNGDCDVGTEWIEVYENVIEEPVYSGYAVRIRGGAGAIWNNTVRGYSLAVRLTEMTPQPTGWVYIWGNRLGSGVRLVDPSSSDPRSGLEANGRPDFRLSAPSGYEAYPYPHPLVVDLVADAGPDMRTRPDAVGGRAQVFLDAGATTAAEGTVTGFRWYVDGEPVSDCARDILDLAEGQYLLLLAAERDDGLREYDTAVVHVEPAGSLVSSTTWAERWFVPLVGTATISYTVTPAANEQDAYVTISGPHDIGEHGDNAILIRTGPSGVFDARNGDTYSAASRIPYSAGTNYRVVMEIDLARQTYSATVDGVPLAEDYAFRLREASLAQITAWHATGGLTVDGLAIEGERAQPDPECREEPPPEDAGPDASPDADITDVAPDGALDAGPDSAIDADTSPIRPDADIEGFVRDGGPDAEEDVSATPGTEGSCACRAAGGGGSGPAGMRGLIRLLP